jgi:alpha-beta hydrolase superfamily lysophospholipase
VTSQQDGVVPRRKLEMLMPSRQPTIVLVHGAFANTSSWSKLIPLLMAKGFSVVAPFIAR